MFQLHHLDDLTRQLMLEEIDLDISQNTLYLGSRLSNTGRRDYPELLREAAQSHDIDWLAEQLGERGRLNATEQVRKTKGGYTTKRVPHTAPETMAEGEFNRFYVRALCRRVISEGGSELVVYRAKEVMQPRSESLALIGKRLNAQQLLNDLRTHQGMDTALRVPPGANSGLSVRLP